MVDINYYRKIQNTYGTENLRHAKTQQIKMELNNDFDKSLDCFTILVDGVAQDLTIIETKNIDEKKIKARPDTSFYSGQIVEWMNWHWLITKVNKRNDIITSGKMIECNFHLYWQDSTGKIINKWAFIRNASNSSIGESGNNTIVLANNQFIVIMPKDRDTKNLKDIRMFIDNCDDNKPASYKLTKPDNITTEYGDGCVYYIFTKDQRNDSTDKKVILEDGTQVWICNYISPTIQQPQLSETLNQSTILLNFLSAKDFIKLGGNYTTFKCVVSDINGNPIDNIGTFSITADFDTDILIINTDTENQIKIKISDDYKNLIGQAFELVFTVNDVSISKTITINDYM